MGRQPPGVGSAESTGIGTGKKKIMEKKTAIFGLSAGGQLNWLLSFLAGNRVEEDVGGGGKEG